MVYRQIVYHHDFSVIITLTTKQYWLQFDSYTATPVFDKTVATITRWLIDAVVESNG